MTEPAPASHPLDGCDQAECYQTMMGERTALITARREAEDNLIKTVIQLSAALLALLAGFISQAKLDLSLLTLVLFGFALAALGVAIVAGLLEQRFSSQAYLAQQKLVEDYFQKIIYEFSEPVENKSVRKAQGTAFVSFVVALLCLGTFAVVEAGENYGKSKRPTTTSHPRPSGQTGNSKAGQAQRLNPVSSTVNAAAPAKEEIGNRNGEKRPNSLPEKGR